MPVSCTDIYGNAGGDWVGNLAGQLGVNGNISEDPLFCDAANGNLQLDFSSPCLFAECGTMGAWGIGCPAEGVVEAAADLPARIVPDPMTVSCRLALRVSEAGRVSVLIADVGGRAIRHLYDSWTPRGELSLDWNRRDDAGRTMPSGLYLMRIASRSARATRRIVVLQ
jgi:hypothetical protein